MSITTELLPAESQVAAINIEDVRTPSVGDLPGRILVVDDTEFNRDLMQEQLSDDGFLVRTAASGEEAIEIAHEWRPEAILLDIQMPGLDGIETCRVLKNRPTTRMSPIVFLTAHETNDALIVEALDAGGSDFLQKPFSPLVLAARLRCQVALFRTQLRMWSLAITDELTGLLSRRYLLTELRRAVRSVSRGGERTLSLVMVDLDQFKGLNDRAGHLAGDAALVAAARLIERSIRAEDYVARYGGDEFMALLPDTGVDDAKRISERIRKGLRGLRLRDGARGVTGSIGYVTCSSQALEGLGLDPNQIIRAADISMYDAKASGRDCVRGGRIEELLEEEA